MWITTCHRFTNRAEFLAACLAAGWICPQGQDPEPPPGVAIDILGPIVGPAQVREGNVLVAGEVVDSRYHVNLSWHGREPDPAFQASLVVPEMPLRGWDVATPPASQPAVPPSIRAWSGLAWLDQAGKLYAAEAVAQAGGPIARHAWARSAQWPRQSPLMMALAAGLGLSDAELDAAFIAADAIAGG